MAERVEETEARLKSSLQILQGTLTSVDAPTDLFRDAGGDEKAQRYIQLILKYAVPSPTGSCTLNELAEPISKETATSRDTAKDHIRARLKDGVVDASPGKAIRLIGIQLRPVPSEIA